MKTGRRHDRVLAVLVGLLAFVVFLWAREFYRAWQDYQSGWVRAITGRSGVVYGVAALVYASSAAALAYGATRLWKRGDR